MCVCLSGGVGSRISCNEQNAFNYRVNYLFIISGSYINSFHFHVRARVFFYK